MPSKSKDQQRAAGMALSAKRGKLKPSELQGSAKQMYDSMSQKDLEDFASTKHDGLPEKVEEDAVEERDGMSIDVKKGMEPWRTKKNKDKEDFLRNSRFKPKKLKKESIMSDEIKKMNDAINPDEKIDELKDNFDIHKFIMETEFPDLVIEDDSHDILVENYMKFLCEAYKFKVGEKFKVDNKEYSITKVTKDHIELEDSRGFEKIVRLSSIKSIKGGKIVAENEDVVRMQQLSGVLEEKQNDLIKLFDKTTSKYAIGLILFKYAKDNIKIYEDKFFIKLSPKHAIVFSTEDNKLHINWTETGIPKGGIGREDVVNAAKQIKNTYNNAQITKKLTDANSAFAKKIKKLGELLKKK